MNTIGPHPGHLDDASKHRYLAPQKRASHTKDYSCVRNCSLAMAVWCHLRSMLFFFSSGNIHFLKGRKPLFYLSLKDVETVPGKYAQEPLLGSHTGLQSFDQWVIPEKEILELDYVTNQRPDCHGQVAWSRPFCLGREMPGNEHTCGKKIHVWSKMNFGLEDGNDFAIFVFSHVCSTFSEVGNLGAANWKPF